jgi:pimeloyl-ACP methyl ester carboxylesterase
MATAAATLFAARRVAPAAAVSELSFQLADGIKLAAQRWIAHSDSQASSRRILCLHGWLDNARSFHHLAPSLASKLPSTEVVALDFPGHGLSSHKSKDAPMMQAEYAYYVSEAVRSLEWDERPFTLVGHSMGAAVALLYGAAYPEQIDKMVLLDGIGPFTNDPKDVAKNVRAHTERRQQGMMQQQKPPRIYPSINAAAEARKNTASLSPGNQYLSQEAAYELVCRATVEVDGGVQFRHDPRLHLPPIQYFTPEENDGLYEDVQCPTCVLLGEDGWPLGEKRLQRARELLQPAVFEVLPGSHHLHADPNTADRVAEAVLEFLDSDFDEKS